jgi:hypothetical protein
VDEDASASSKLKFAWPKWRPAIEDAEEEAEDREGEVHALLFVLLEPSDAGCCAPVCRNAMRAVSCAATLLLELAPLPAASEGRSGVCNSDALADAVPLGNACPLRGLDGLVAGPVCCALRAAAAFSASCSPSVADFCMRDVIRCRCN